MNTKLNDTTFLHPNGKSSIVGAITYFLELLYRVELRTLYSHLPHKPGKKRLVSHFS